MKDLYPGTYNPNARVSDACKRSTDFGPEPYTWERLPECAMSTMSGLHLVIEDRVQTKDSHPVPG